MVENTGIYYMPPMKKGWRLTRIGYVCDKVTKSFREDSVALICSNKGKVVERPDDVTGKMVSEDHAMQGISKGDIAIHGMDTWHGAIAYSDLDGKITRVVHVCDSSEENRFIVYYLQLLAHLGVYKLISNGVRGNTSDFRSWDKVKDIRISLPSFEEQRAIADYLDKKTADIDAAIKEAQELIEKYKEYKRSKVKEIFDYYLSKESYVKAKLGSLASLVTKQTGFDYSNTISPSLVGELTENTLPYIQTRHFKDNYWNYETEYYIPKNVARLFPQIILDKRCLLFSIVGASIGNVAVYPGEVKAFLGGAICKVDLFDEDNYDYIKHYMMSCDGQEQISFNIKASAQGTITVQNVRDFKIPIFEDKSIKEKISSRVDDISSKIYALIKDKENLISKLQEYRKSIIFEYVTGKKEVPNG